MHEQDIFEQARAVRELSGRPDPVGFDRRYVSPPSRVYIEREDTLVVVVSSPLATFDMQVSGRLQQPGGDVTPFQQRVAVSAGQQLVATRLDLGEGYLLSLTLRGTSSSPLWTQTFVTVSIERGRSADAIPAQVLVAGYLNKSLPLGWPEGGELREITAHGFIRSVTNVAPAAGAEWSIVLGAGARQRWRSIRFSLTTSVAVATRRVHVIVDDGANILLDLAANDTQLASLTRNYNCPWDGFQRAAQDSEIYIPLPPELIMVAGFRVRSSTTNLQAADAFSAQQIEQELWVEE